MCTQCRKYLWHAANNCEETRGKVTEKEIQKNFKISFWREEKYCFLSLLSRLFSFVCQTELDGYTIEVFNVRALQHF